MRRCQRSVASLCLFSFFILLFVPRMKTWNIFITAEIHSLLSQPLGAAASHRGKRLLLPLLLLVCVHTVCPCCVSMLCVSLLRVHTVFMLCIHVECVHVVCPC